MTLSLRVRVVIAMGMAAVVTVAVLGLTLRAAVHDVPFLQRWHVSAADLAACEAAPATWHLHIFDFGDAYAYDLDGRSANPAAPRLDRTLLERARRDGTAIAGGPGPSHVELQQVASRGACAWMRVRVGAPPPKMASAAGWGVLLGSALSLLLMVALATWFVLKPLLERIRRIGQSAASVGSPDYVAAVDASGDDLSAIADVLSESHLRIAASEAELRERQLTLERHMAELAHDLRTPLASLLLAVQELHPMDNPAASRALADVEYLTALVDNLHQATLLERGLHDGTWTGVDLAELVQRLEARFAALGALRGIAVAASFPDTPVVAKASPALVERAIANLIHNAVQHGRPGGHVAIVLDQREAGFTLTITDDGPGLAPGHVETLREWSQRNDVVRPRDEGLGLTIALEAARRFGWQVVFEGNDPSGLCVRIAGTAAIG